MSMASVASPTAAGFTGPPPTAGMDVYKVAPTNSVYFGPYLRYMNMDVERGLWMGSILLITDAAQPPTIHIHQSVDLSPNRKMAKSFDSNYANIIKPDNLRRVPSTVINGGYSTDTTLISTWKTKAGNGLMPLLLILVAPATNSWLPVATRPVGGSLRTPGTTSR
jgi:hypothetical protein